MEVSEENYKLCGDYYEHLVFRRNTPSVSLLVSSLQAFIHFLVPHSAKIHGLTNEEQNLAEDTFKRFGPIPRICINFVQDRCQLRAHERHCQIKVMGITEHNFRHFVLKSIIDLDDEEKDTIFIIKRDEVDDIEGAHLEPISAIVKMQLMMVINAIQLLERINLYHAFASLPETRVVASLLYESLGYTRLQEGIPLTLKPMIKLSPSQRQRHFHWKSQGEEQASKSMDLDDSGVSVIFPPNTAIIYEGELVSVEPNHLHVQVARNQVALDSFLKLGQILYIFQFTSANEHEIDRRKEEFLSELLNILPPKTNWRFVFITPPGCDIDVKATSAVEKFLEGVTLYSAHLKFKQ
jgi:hypothetical protein